MSWEELLINVLLVSIVLQIILIIRVYVTSHIRRRRLNEIEFAACKLIMKRKPYKHLFEEFERGPSFDAIKWDLTKWTTRSVYKDLE